MKRARFGLLLASMAAGCGLPRLAPAQETPTFRVDVRVVNVLATVRDPGGRIVLDLSKDDFILEEDGKRQEIKYFSRQTDLPLTIGLLVDTSMSQRNLIKQERSASTQFFDQVLRPDRDQAFVIRFDVEVELLQDLTSSRLSLQDALNALDVPATRRRTPPGVRPNRLRMPLMQRWPGGMPVPGGPRKPGQGGLGRLPGIGTLLFDAVFLASEEVLTRQEGRKAIILISDGVDYGSKLGIKEAIEAAQRADTIIYCVRYFDPSTYTNPFSKRKPSVDPDPRGAEALAALSKATGGRMFEVTQELTLDDIYGKIQEELRSQYNLGYTPPEHGKTGFRRITVRSPDGTLEVLARAGYYPKR